ncbi:pentatricopeptide repeat-containing protein At4g02750 [Telopea speciosissima]|uniref:pentatricopeptide repeat-containing protein At4g02750 n=1 Tax=Telopea speciosissima TaxID=54955 RepID=UPI001CC5C3FB|nr:pentatricopeptide repeat-containing protein At4g02750 [Telopea speciosissima]
MVSQSQLLDAGGGNRSSSTGAWVVGDEIIMHGFFHANRCPGRNIHSSSALRFIQSKRIGDSQTRLNRKASRSLLRPERGANKKNSSPISDAEVVRWNKSISEHMRNGRCDFALHLFQTMPHRTSVSWNAMISGYIMNNRFDLARQFFDRAPNRDLVSWNVMLHGYVRNRNFSAARALFDMMPKRDVVSWNTMLSGYAQGGYVDEAREIFDRIPDKNSISWNGILATYIHNGRIESARQLFDSKSDWEIVSWNSMMAGYLRKKRLVDARCFFDRIPKRDEVSWNTMITGYAQNGELLEAQKLFEESPIRDVFTWTAMVSGYVQNGMLMEARRIFDEMPEKNSVSWNAMIVGYSQSRRMDLARELFDAMPCRNISSWNTMITGYAQNGEIDHARSLFDEMPHRDSISWAAIIAGYAQSGHSEEALCLFLEMKRDGERMNRSTFTCALSTCADIAALELGMQVHGQLVKAGYETGCYVGNALLAMYCKCGSIDEAYDVFIEMPHKDVVTWNTMITGYAKHGYGREALKVFESMTMTGIRPDDVTMVSVLSACSHTGLVNKGTEYFYSMEKKYGITAKVQHYTCMIDLLGRAGRLEDAQLLLKNMPFEPDGATWGALLGASRIHGDTKLGEEAAKRIFELEPDNSGMYVLLSNLYAASGRWNDVGKMRLIMRDSGVRKVPGYSWIEVQNKVHTFSVGDSVHPDKDKIYDFLEELDLQMKRDGYVSKTKMVLHDVDEEEKEHMLKYHSEKLAVAFGILTVPPGRPIRVIKNLRVCEDCHSAIKHISKIVRRLIILRDSNRFHHFNNGNCSCGDYW